MAPPKQITRDEILRRAGRRTTGDWHRRLAHEYLSKGDVSAALLHAEIEAKEVARRGLNVSGEYWKYMPTAGGTRPA